jgi:hypothetical protein
MILWLNSEQGVGKVLTKHENEQLEQIHWDGDYFHQEGIFTSSLQDEQMDYRKRDYLFRGGEWRGLQFPPLISSKSTARVLVVGHSDFEVKMSHILAVRQLSNYKRIYASNLGGYSRVSNYLGARMLPLGLSNPTRESQAHIIFGDTSVLSQAFFSTSPPRRTMDPTQIYSNVTPTTSKRHRQELYRSLPEVAHVRQGLIDPTLEGRKRYLSEIRETGLVLCPAGNGPDTHRLYETLYMGAIPVVLRNSYQFKLCRNLGFPAVGLDNWKQVSDLELVRRMAADERFSARGLRALRLSSWVGPEGFLLR